MRIVIYVNVNKKLKKVISEFCFTYLLKDNKIKIKRNHCCGESPYTSNRTFKFKKDKFSLIDNYVIFNDSDEILAPKNITSNNYTVKVENDNYNVRYSPNIKKYKEKESYFSCESYTNIIGKLKKGSELKVLSQIKKEDRIWLFVEIKESDLKSELCDVPMNYDYKNQKLRAWISNTFIKRI